jgi:hypothetical protein
MPALAELATIIDSADQSFGQAESLIAGLQQYPAAFGAPVPLIELLYERRAA